LDAVIAASNKLLTRATLQQAGLATPRFQAVSIETDPASIAPLIDYPCVVKPGRPVGKPGRDPGR